MNTSPQPAQAQHTPETDEASGLYGFRDAVSYDFARSLERDRNALAARVKELEAVLESLLSALDADQRAELRVVTEGICRPTEKAALQCAKMEALKTAILLTTATAAARAALGKGGAK